MRVREVLGNILWFIFGGALIFLFYCLGGLILCLTIVGIPFGIEAFKLGALALLPFGSEIGERIDPLTGLRFVFNILWFLLFGWEIALLHLILALIFAVTIIGLPFAYQHFKLAAVGMLPFGKVIVHW
ncbi:hypothetical protein BC832DRAFT_560648 [Gaertneriomyces semiglobifer]|nr:hypothetical protein BC832DRAFT_560648 [Gaertneriomyces semiglobifer]